MFTLVFGDPRAPNSEKNLAQTQRACGGCGPVAELPGLAHCGVVLTLGQAGHPGPLCFAEPSDEPRHTVEWPCPAPQPADDRESLKLHSSHHARLGSPSKGVEDAGHAQSLRGRRARGKLLQAGAEASGKTKRKQVFRLPALS